MAEYFVGLDIGTESIGWAVTDVDYNLIKKSGKALWGVRLFPEANKAEERRGFRTARRRLARRNQRIEWLRQIFSEEIAKVDPAFFMRIDESKYLEADKRTNDNGMPLGRYTLFADRNYCDKDYHKDFPTIYHLRKALITEDKSFDVRLVYLAIHHILKKRGHFLFGDMEMDDISFENCIKEVCEYLREQYEVELSIDDMDAFKTILSDNTQNITKKKTALKKCAAVTKEDKQLAAIMDLLSGGKTKVSAVCDLEIPADTDISFSFKGDYENAEPQLQELLGDDMRLIEVLKKLYDWSLLEKLRNGKKYLSFSKVEVYEQHRKDLSIMKRLFRLDKKLYKEMFRMAGEKIDNYPAYSGHHAQNYRCDYDKFCIYAKRQIKSLMGELKGKNLDEAKRIIEEMDAGIFLPMQTNKDNGVIPHQLHEQELCLILERASGYLPFLNYRDESGLSRKEQIMEVFRFRIPYYVGPLNTASEKGWLVRTDERIMPWNFEKVVDLSASAANFITRMTATCSYIGEPVLPKDSLLYSKFVVLNAINKIQVNGYPISVDTKQKIFNQHIIPRGKATFKSIRDFMLSEGFMYITDVISGIDETFKASVNGYQVFNQLLSGGNNFLMVEDIIKHIVLYGEDRKLLEKWLGDEYGDVLSTADIAYVLRNRNRFSGWGNLSGEFLTQIEHYDENTGEITSVIDALWNTNHNLMELLSSRFNFTDSINKWRENKYGTEKRTLDKVLEDSYASPGIRRAIHQTIAIISEIEKIMGCQPKRVFIEVTRSEGEKERTVSRRKQLDALYEQCKKDVPDVYEQLQGYDDAALRSAKYYLYFTQMGKCMYSGEPIDISRLATDYDIDHIYPQSRVKDDSLSNRVLVKRTLNAEKTDTYPLSDAIRSKMKPFWNLLKSRKLISEEKYRRLTRNTPFDDNELSGFIARQLVETSQACKIVAELLKNRYEGSDRVVYVKAGNVSSFRQDQRILSDGTPKQAGACKGVITKKDPLFVKCREVNDFHHAKDAYLNIVVGNVYHTKFTRNPVNFIKKRQTYSLNRMFDFDVVRNGETAWRVGEEGSIAVVRKMMAKNNILFTRYAHEVTGGLFDQQIVPKGKGQAMIKSSDPRMTTENYGGYNKVTGAYFMLVEHTDKNKRVRSIETVFLMHKALYERDAIAYCEGVLGLTEPRILIPKIKIDSLVSYDGFRMHISGRGDVRILYKNANQLILSPSQIQYIKQVSKYVERCQAAKTDLKITVYDEITYEQNLMIYRLLCDKLATKLFKVKYGSECALLAEKNDIFAQKSLPDQCRMIMQILNLFKAGAVKADLSLLGGSKSAGTLRTSKNLTGMKSVSFILVNQSVTGFYEQKIDLLGDEF